MAHRIVSLRGGAAATSHRISQRNGIMSPSTRASAGGGGGAAVDRDRDRDRIGPSGRRGRRRDDRDLDVIVYGATGFTGALVAEYFARLGRAADGCTTSTTAPPPPPPPPPRRPVRWAVAGRSESKLLSLAERLRGPPPSSDRPGAGYPDVVVAPLTDPDSLSSMCRRTRVVISAAGPFLPDGLPLVGACVESGTDYVDITGETPFVRRSMDLYQASAVESGTYVYHMCGFDSVPSDLGAWRAVRRIGELYGEGCSSVTTYVAMRGKLSGGTLESGIRMESDPESAAVLADPYALGGRPPGGPRSEDEDVTTAEPFADGMAWTAPFGMAKLNTRVVRRSASDLGYGPPNFAYREMMLVPDEVTAGGLARGPAPVEKRVALRERGRLPRPGEGPSEEERGGGWFHFVIVGVGSDTGRKVITSVSGGDPGYDETAKMVSEAALTLAEDRDGTLAARMGVGGGVLTPAYMGDALLGRLRRAGIRFEDEGTDGDEGAVVAAMLRGQAGRARL